MMAKQALLDVLEQTIGRYVVGLDAQSLNVAVWSGHIELKALELNVAAVNAFLDRHAAEAPNLAIPFRVVSGNFGNFQIHVPWSQLLSQPVVAQASQLSVTIEPFDRSSTNNSVVLDEDLLHESEASRAQKLQEQRTQALKSAEVFRNQTNTLKALAEQDIENSTQNNTFAARLVRRIVENLQIEISGVHIAVQSTECSAGVVLGSLQLVTVDKDGKRTFVDRSKTNDAFLYKNLSIAGLGIYLDQESKPTISGGRHRHHETLKSIVESKDEDFDEAISTPLDASVDALKSLHSYVLSPLSFDADFRQADSNTCVDFPKYKLNSELTSLDISLSRAQLELANSILGQIRPTLDAPRLLFPEYRPLSRVTKETAIEWWKYAVRCIGRLNGRRSWVEFFRAFQSRKLYIELYKRNAHSKSCSWMQPLQIAEIAKMHGIEMDRSIHVDAIMMWRNIADAQKLKEEEKHREASNSNKTKPSLFTSLFGGGAQKDDKVESSPPIRLTVEELKELEKLTVEQEFDNAESSLSSDSQLCEVHFVLGSCCIHLTSHNDSPLTSLEMGAVTSTFNANQDGSFIFDSALTSLEVEDRVTPRTRFPTILKNQTKDTLLRDALRVHLAKSKNGDQHLIIKLDTFEIVASPTLLLELRKFGTLSSELTGPQKLVRTNPLLTQSLSGSIDLFYDAAQGNDLTAKDTRASITSSMVESPFHPSKAGQDDLSKALIDAWKTKTETKASWFIDLDLHAPILIIPENCIDPRANVLIFNLGHLRCQYGSGQSSPTISKWFSNNPRRGESSNARTDLVLDNGLIQISNLTFSVGKTSYWRRLVHKNGGSGAPNDDEAIIEPVSLSLDFAVESGDEDEIPRLCLIGVLPCLAVRLSASQCSRIMSVVVTWQQRQKDFIHESEESGADTIEEEASYASQSSFQRKLQESSVLAHLASQTFSTAIVTRFNFDVRLQRLSAKILDNMGNAIEAHLVSVAFFACVRSDGSICNNLTMGWFWILDRVDNEFPRRQRLVAHSTLPIAADDIAKEGKYDIIGELSRRGVFDESFSGSTDLADIQFKQSPPGKTFGFMDPYSADADVSNEECDVSYILDAQFTNLFIYWNPQAVKAMLSMLMAVAKTISSISQSESENVVVITDPSQISPRRRKHSLDSIRSKTNLNVEKPSRMKLNARMDGLHISLNSARDDLPLFICSMASASVSMVLDGKNTQLHLALGEVKIETPPLGKTLPCYRHILGIAPGESKSLLLVRYFDGPKAISSCPSSLVKDLSNYETYAEVELSPMRMIYIQAQMLSLVEFATAGILGALTAQAASSAANAAIELTSASVSKKLFNVEASGFDLIIPQAAYSEKYVSLHLGALCVDYIASPDSSGEANLELIDVAMRDTESLVLLSSPVRVEIEVELPPEGMGTKDDQAIVVEMDISAAHFLVSKEQYEQLLTTLDENIGEIDLFLRDVSLSMNTSEKEKDLFIVDDYNLFGNLTHAGIEMVFDPRRVRVSLQLSNLALTLFSGCQDDSLLRLSAVTACVNFKTIPDCGRFNVALTLRDLECVDLRMKAMTRQHRSLIYQPGIREENQERQDFFFVSYETHDDKVEMKVRLGSPRLVFIPDAISDVLTFLNVDRKQMNDESPRPYPSKETYREVIAIDSDKDAAVEACFSLEPEFSQVSTLLLSLNTSQCSVILVDLGSDSLTKNSKFLSSSVEAEVIVIGGSFDSTLQMKTEKCSGKVFSYVSELHGDHIEVFTAFGRDLANAIQILDPTQLSCFVKYREATERGDSLDIRCAVISPLDVTLSIRNYALFNAILTSASDCFVDPKTDDESKGLSEEEMKRIQKLAIDLDSSPADSSVHSHDSTRDEEDSITTTKSVADPNMKSEITVKITTPEMKLTLVNDLQGLDEALVRVSVRNFIANGITQTGQKSDAGSHVYTAFDFSVHTSVDAHYFDSSYNDWRTLLLHSWELSAKGNRGSSQRFRSNRPSTTLDIESLPCHLSFSEQFLMSLASAYRMWSVYSAASSSALESLEKISCESLHVRKSMAASAARTFISSLPYAIENHCGVDINFLINDEKKMRRICRTGKMFFFRFEPPVGNGSGGSRLYGQDVTFEKYVTLLVGSDEIQLHHLDLLLGQPRASHEAAGNIIMTEVIKEGKTIIVHVSSGIDVINRSRVPFAISAFFPNEGCREVGLCMGDECQANSLRCDIDRSLTTDKNKASRESKKFGIPLSLTETFRKDWKEKNEAQISIAVSPKIDGLPLGWELSGGTKLTVNKSVFSGSNMDIVRTRFDITCRPISRQGISAEKAPRELDSFVLQAIVSMMLIDGKHPSILVTLEPRVSITNKMPISASLKTPMPHVFSASSKFSIGEESVHDIVPHETIEIFTPGPSIAIIVKCTEMPIGGTTTGWMDGGWVDLPLMPEFRLQEPLVCMFPFSRKSADPLGLSGSKGTEFFILDGCSSPEDIFNSPRRGVSGNSNALHSPLAIELAAPPSIDEDWRSYSIVVSNYAVDHTGEILFEQLSSNEASLRRSSSDPDKRRRSTSTQISSPLGAFPSAFFRGRVSILPGLQIPIRLLHLTMEGEDGIQRSSPFTVDDISISDGGVDSTPITWDSGKPSGFFAYRHLVTPFQSEVHVIPEYVIYNGSTRYGVTVRLNRGVAIFIDPGKIAPLRIQFQEAAMITVDYPELGGMTPPLRIDALGLRMAIVSSHDGRAIGSFALQTVVGSADSRLAVKLGDINLGARRLPDKDTLSPYSVLSEDFLRLRIRWVELKMTLNEARPITAKNQAILESALDRIHEKSNTIPTTKKSSTAETWVSARERKVGKEVKLEGQIDSNAICTILFHRFTIDWQRVFKDDNSPPTQRGTLDALDSPERAQLSLVIHNVLIKDETPDSLYPVVFDSTSHQVSFFDLCFRFRGKAWGDFVTIDLIDLNLAHANGVSEKIYVSTSEDFIWKLLDLADRIITAAAEFAGVDIRLDWDKEQESFSVAIKENSNSIQEITTYTPPRCDTIYHIKKTRVSPFEIVASFKRTPQASRYKMLRGVKGANIMNYFTGRLKFKIDKAVLSFARYEVVDVKGPPDRIIELISTVYLSRMKTKLVTIMTAASFQDWKFLSARVDGEDEFLEGDILRATGNIAGNTAAYVLKRAGRGIGGGVSTAASRLGKGIESATDVVGARAIGAGVNSLVTGVGEGVGDTISGVGSGAGKIVKGAGQGVGQVFGGLTGGVLIAGKGIGKGITTGDGGAVVSGITQGAASIGQGVGQGVESVVTGATDGVLSVGHGLFSGVKNVGRGIGGAFTGKKSPSKPPRGPRKSAS